MKTVFYPLVVVAFTIGLTNCKKKPETVEERLNQAVEQAKAQTNDPAVHAAIDEAKRVAAETNRPVEIKVTEQIEVQPGAPMPPPAPVVIDTAPPVGGATVAPPPPVPVVPPEPRRTPGEVLDKALEKVGEGLQRAGEKIEDVADDARR